VQQIDVFIYLYAGIEDILYKHLNMKVDNFFYVNNQLIVSQERISRY